jgi:hypothetical protein
LKTPGLRRTQDASNPQHVRCVRPGNADSAVIEFDNTHHVTVKASMIDVTRGLTARTDAGAPQGRGDNDV